MSWWEFGEHSGYSGGELASHRIRCAFCDSEGNFAIIHHEEKKHPSNPKKVLNYETTRCGNCANLTMIFWSASGQRTSTHNAHHDFKTLPSPTNTTNFPTHWPRDVGRYWVQAQRSLEGKNWDAAALMARSAVQLLLRYQNAKGSNLKQEIEDLATKGQLPPIMKEWSHEIRELGNDNAHPSPGAEGTNQQDAKDVVEFLGVLMVLTYNLPHQIEQYRKRGKTKPD